MELYLNTELTPKKRAQDLLSKLSLDEKMAQVNCLFTYDGDWEWQKEYTRYGIGQVSALEVREMKSLKEAVTWQNRLQKQIIENSPHHIPAIFHMEGLCGAFIQESARFPSGIARASTWDPELEEQVGQTVGRQELSCGITQVLAPVLDISRDSRLGRQGETYGEDPTLAASMGTAYIKGVQAGKIRERRAECMAKHFLGFHHSQAGIHGAHCDIPDRLLYEVYGKPFQAVIRNAGLRGIMPCYCSINGEPVSASKRLLTGLLRGEMGFDGICGADYGAVGNVYRVQKIGEGVTEAGLLCMEAGMDVEMQNCCGFNEELKEWFQKGQANIDILNRAVQRILEAKFRMGLFEHPFALEGEELCSAFFSGEEQRVSLRCALESLVLLKNENVLPLSKNVKKIAVIGCHAQNARCFFGGYTHMSMAEAVYAAANSIAGMETGNVKQQDIDRIPGTQIQNDETEEFDAVLRLQKPECRNLLEELQAELPDTEILYAYGYPIAGDDLSHIQEALDIAGKADVVILTLGGKHGSCSIASMGEGVDSTDINLPVCQDTFIRRAAELNKPLIGVHFNGRPISSDIADQYLDAIIEAWNPAEMGAQAIVKVLLGEYNPGGKLPVSVAYNAGQIPVYYNHPNGSSYHQGESIGFQNYVDTPHTPRYFFGHGLSYTTFEYTDLKLDKKDVRPEDSVKIEVTVQNIGKYAGDEVVQLYFRDLYASLTRPVKELAGFQRITLAAGEKKTLVFTLEASQTAFLDRDMKWKIERGGIEVQVGSSSEDIRLKEAFTITENAWIEGRNRGFYAECVISP